jgi:trimeric autotransporter adhesin
MIMKTRKKLPSAFSFLLIALLIAINLQSCSDEEIAVEEEDDTDTTAITDDFETNTQSVNYENAVTIVYDSVTATITNPLAESGVAVTVTGGDVVVTSTIMDTEVNYILSGVIPDGSLKLYSDYKFKLIFNGVAIANNDGPAVNIQSGKKASVELVAATHNRLVDGTTYASSEEDQKGTFFSEGQIVFEGNGDLLLYGRAKHAIASDDYVSVKAGDIKIVTAASDGIHANDYVSVSGGTLDITSSEDGIDAEEGYVEIAGGDITVTSVDDGITASYDGEDTSITPYINIVGGIINVTTTGEKANAIKSEGNITVNTTGVITLTTTGKAGKGFKATADFTLIAGDVNITTAGAAFYDSEDADIASSSGIKGDGDVSIEGGTLTITSTGAGGKGISVDGTLTIAGGTTDIAATGSNFSNAGESSEAKGIKADGAIVINDGTVTIAASDDGIKSATSITTNGGSVVINKSVEGIEAPRITFNKGNVSVMASDDCVNSTNGNGGESNDNSVITFAGGVIALNSSGGDAIDSNGNVIMTGGSVIVQGPSSQPELAIDYNGTFKISGGLLIASGPNSGRMIQATSTSSTQNTVLVQVSTSANTAFNIQDASGNTLVNYKPSRNAYYFVFSSSLLQSGDTYKVYTGGSITGGESINGLTTGGSYTAGTLKGSFTVSSKVTTASF